MTHLEELLAYWDGLSKGETPTTHKIREAVQRDQDEAAALAALAPGTLAYPYVLCRSPMQLVCTHSRCQERAKEKV